MDQRQVFENYLFEKPLAVSIAHLLNEKKEEGMTARSCRSITPISSYSLPINFGNASVRLIKSERKGRKNIFKISQEFKDILPSLL